jgi:hypothetical protein
MSPGVRKVGQYIRLSVCAISHGSLLTASLSAASVTLNLRECNEPPECRSLELSVKYENLLDKQLHSDY